MNSVSQSDVEAMLRKYCLPMTTLENIRHNAAVLGISFISLAEEQGFKHEYDDALENCATKQDLYLLLGELYAKGHHHTQVMRATVERIACISSPTNPAEIRDIKYAVIWSEELSHLVNQHTTH